MPRKSRKSRTTHKKLKRSRGFKLFHKVRYFYLSFFVSCLILLVSSGVILHKQEQDRSVLALTSFVGYGSAGPQESIPADRYQKGINKKLLDVSYKDLSYYTPPIINQLPLNSCVTMAFGYEAMGWYARRDGYYPTGYDAKGGFAAMYIYSQVSSRNGGDDGSSPYDVLNTYLKKQGIDTRADYGRTKNPDTKIRPLPSQENKNVAKYYKIGGYKQLFSYPNINRKTTQDKNAIISDIKAAMAAGDPVVIDFSMPTALMRPVSVAGKSYKVMLNDGGGANQNGHEMFADNFNLYGLGLVNTWGTSWGKNGRAVMPWSLVAKYARAAYVIRPVRPVFPKPTATPTPKPSCPSGTKCISLSACRLVGGTGEKACGVSSTCCKY